MLTVRTLGGLAVLADGRPLTGAAAQRRRLAVLALVARAGSRGISREKVMALLWPDVDEERARRIFNQALYALRRDLGNVDAITGSPDLRLDPALIAADVTAFEDACTAGEWQRAVASYEGPFLDGFVLADAGEFERWADAERRQLAHLFAQGIRHLAAAATSRGDHATATGLWRRLAAADPLSGRVALALMQSLVDGGDRNGAIQHARVHAALLEQDLDAHPDPDVVDFAERLKREPVAVANRANNRATVSVAAADATASSVASSIDMPVMDIASAPKSVRRMPGVRGRWLIGAAAVAGVAVAVIWVATRDSVPVVGRTSRLSIEPDLELDPAISPDGRMIAYAAGRIGETRIVVRLLAGGKVLDVSGDVPGPHRLPRWSPDGQTLAFQGRGAIYGVSALGGVPRVLVADDSARGHAVTPAWAPDGKWMAYVRGDRLIIHSFPAGKERTLATIRDVHSPAWSPDGLHVAVVAGNGAFVLGAPAPSVANLGNIAPSTIYVVSAKGKASQVAITDGEHLAVSPTWAPDSRHLLYLSNQDGSRDVWVATLGSDGAVARAPRRLTTGLGAHGLALSADGHSLAYSTLTYVDNIWAVRLPAGDAASVRDARPVTTGNQAIEGMSVSPDGTTLAFDSDRAGNQDIWKVVIDGGAPQQVTTTPWDEFMPTWSPDGSELVFYAFRGGIRKLYVVPAAGGGPQPISRDSIDERYPHWSPDGQRILFSRWIAGRYEVFSSARVDRSRWGPALQLTHDGAENPRWSRDGNQFAFVRSADGTLWVADANGANARLVVRGRGTAEEPFPVLAEWSATGSAIFYSAVDSLGKPSIRSVAAAGGVSRPLVRFDDPHHTTNRPEFATDRKQVYFTIGTPGADLWMIELNGRW